MKVNQINMPQGFRYMGEYKDQLLYKILPLDKKFIINKSIPGCGGTSMFLDSKIPIVLISPRVRVLVEKDRQYKNSKTPTFLFHTEFTSKTKREEEIKKMMSDLNSYIQRHWNNPFDNYPRPPKILVSLDSAKKVLDVIAKMGLQDKFLFVVDEFQCLMGDANYKGSTDMNFLSEIDKMVPRICYLSATPIPDQYLDYIPQFKDLDYYKLEWDPSVLEDPTIREVKMKKGESVESVCEDIVTNYREHGYFARKVWNGNIVESKEVCIFLNEVKKIKNIILKNRLIPEETTILCSTSNAHELPKGFKVGGLSTDKVNPKNKTFTFCTKASFEGVDFYSDNAITYIFVDGNKPWQTLDIYLDIPQILGRQRLDANPFKRDATIFYKTKPYVESETEFREKQKAMELKTKRTIDEYNLSSDYMKSTFLDTIRKVDTSKKFIDDYIDVISDGTTTTVGENTLVKIARWNDWYLRQYFYNHPCQLTTGIQDAVPVIHKPQEVSDFERVFYSANSSDKLRIYSKFMYQYPQHETLVLANPYIPIEYHDWYRNYGYDGLSKLGFDEKKVEQDYVVHCSRDFIIQECKKVFIVGENYSKKFVKNELQKIYDSLGLLGRRAKAVEIEGYMNVKERTLTDESGKRREFYLIQN